MNDGISKPLCSLKYITIYDAIKEIVRLGPDTLPAKIDIENAFCILSVHPADRHVLGMQWNGDVFIDTCLLFGLQSAPKIFNILADLLEWIVKTCNVTFPVHYLDDLLTIGPPGSPTCFNNLDTLIQICGFLGVPLALEKAEGPATTLPILGIVLDTVKMVARLPEEKLLKLHQEVTMWLDRKDAKMHD